MGDFNNDSSSQDESYNYSNITLGSSDYIYTPFGYYDYNDEAGFIMYVVTCIIICIGLQLTLMAIYNLYSLVMNDRVGPVYVINLLISNLIQFCGMIFEMAQPKDRTVIDTFTYIHVYCLVASVCFMVCIALERYLVIACPLWYRFRRTIKISVLVCVVVWIIPLVYFLPFFFWINFRVKRVIFAILLLLPLPLFMFFLGGTLKVLSASISVHSDEKRRIVGLLVLVLLIYMLLFLPSISWFLVVGTKFNKTFSNVSLTFLKLSPLADLFLYVFMKKGTVDKLLASVCCCKMDSDDISSSNSSSIIQV
uniref:ovarian cancer G-protein coupled receptor 1-like n=1 Tax=Epinephelus lanceolatus TaxID=310571 RepID=UPI001444EF1F|nr:ovarian cancer G-protein coupled receptor 1-like [Epinephelus lanceolatus]